LLLIDGPVAAPESGFATSEAKEAFLSGAITTPAELPSGPDRAGGYRIINAADALATLRSTGTGTASGVLTTTAVELGSGSFFTDRGPVDLPAWRISFAGVEHSAAVLAVDPGAMFPPPDLAGGAGGIGATATHDDHKLLLRFVGAAPGTGPCTADYTAHVAEAATAVAVSIEEISHDEPGAADATCTAVGYSREVTITLSSPLGTRVLVDAQTKAAISVHA
jgi:hypothetical protein